MGSAWRAGVGKDAELAAAEIVRRAERGIGLAVRKGQEAGSIETLAQSQSRAGRERHQLSADHTKLSPAPFVGASYERAGIYAMGDQATDEQFNAAIEEAKSEGNLSRVGEGSRDEPDASGTRLRLPANGGGPDCTTVSPTEFVSTYLGSDDTQIEKERRDPHVPNSGVTTI